MTSDNEARLAARVPMALPALVSVAADELPFNNNWETLTTPVLVMLPLPVMFTVNALLAMLTAPSTALPPVFNSVALSKV
ncbi:MAG: hypothetical protein KAX63_06470, partial [Pseudomonas sp.]|nr:hypothetical protein [Pseudomonas sp.]